MQEIVLHEYTNTSITPYPLHSIYVTSVILRTYLLTENSVLYTFIIMYTVTFFRSNLAHVQIMEISNDQAAVCTYLGQSNAPWGLVRTTWTSWPPTSYDYHYGSGMIMKNIPST